MNKEMFNFYFGDCYTPQIKSPECIVTIDTTSLKDNDMSRSLGYVTVVDTSTQEIKSVRYDEFVKILFKSRGTIQQDLEHGIIGCCGETGELADAIKRFTVYGKELNKTNVIEELGDLRWYMQAIQNLLGITEQEILQANANKLAERYKGLIYSDKAAIDRADKSSEKGE